MKISLFNFKTNRNKIKLLADYSDYNIPQYSHLALNLVFNKRFEKIL